MSGLAFDLLGVCLLLDNREKAALRPPHSLQHPPHPPRHRLPKPRPSPLTDKPIEYFTSTKLEGTN